MPFISTCVYMIFRLVAGGARGARPRLTPRQCKATYCMYGIPRAHQLGLIVTPLGRVRRARVACRGQSDCYSWVSYLRCDATQPSKRPVEAWIFFMTRCVEGSNVVASRFSSDDATLYHLQHRPPGKRKLSTPARAPWNRRLLWRQTSSPLII